MEDTEDDEDPDHHRLLKLKQPHRFYLERPRARSESPFAKGHSVEKLLGVTFNFGQF